MHKHTAPEISPYQRAELGEGVMKITYANKNTVLNCVDTSPLSPLVLAGLKMGEAGAALNVSKRGG
jgi:hypothetical protein